MESRALHTVCLEPCLWIGDHLDWCKPPAFSEEEAGKYELFTWVPQEAEWVYLIKLVGFTLAYLPDRDTVYFVNPAFAIGNQCPPNTAFLTQYVKDPGCAARLLAVDILYEKGETLEEVPAAARYARLQSLAQHFPEQHCAVQWCGNLDALTPAFLATLPHKCKGIVGMGRAPADMFMRVLRP